MRAWTIGLTVILLGAAGIAAAQGGGAPAAGRPGTAARTNRLKTNLDHWKSLPAPQKEAMRERMRKLQALPPEQRERVKSMVERFRSLPPERRQALQEKMRALPPEVRHRLAQRALQTGRFPKAEFAVASKICELVKSLPPEERQRLRSLPQDQRKKEVLGLGRKHFTGEYEKTLDETARRNFEALPSEEQWKRVKPWLGKTLGGGEARPGEGAKPPHHDREGEPRSPKPPRPGPR